MLPKLLQLAVGTGAAGQAGQILGGRGPEPAVEAMAIRSSELCGPIRIAKHRSMLADGEIPVLAFSGGRFPIDPGMERRPKHEFCSVCQQSEGRG